MIALPKAQPHWPTTIQDAVDHVLDRLSEEQIEAIRNTPEDDLVTLHFGLGTTIRNELGLWGENTALLAACGSADMEADEASAVIIRAVWERLVGQATDGPSA